MIRKTKVVGQLLTVGVLAFSLCEAPPSFAASTVTYEVTVDDGMLATAKFSVQPPAGTIPSPETAELYGGEAEVDETWTKTLTLANPDWAFIFVYHENKDRRFGVGSHVSCRLLINGKLIEEEDGMIAQCMGPKARAKMPESAR